MTDFQSFGKWLEELEKSRLERERIEMARASELRQQDAQRMANDEERRRREGDQAAIAYHNRELVDPVASQTLGGGRLATLDDARAAGMLNPSGAYLGLLDGTALFYNGDGHLLTYAPTGGGKGRDVILPNLARMKSRSVVTLDLKRGENAYATHIARARVLGHRVIPVNPWLQNGYPTYRINPLQGVIDRVKAGLDVDIEPWRVMEALIPVARATGDDKWARMAAQDLGALRIEYLARFRPSDCSLSGLWRFANPEGGLEAAFDEMLACGDPAIAGVAGKHDGYMRNAPKQFSAGLDALASAVRIYRPGSALGNATSATDFDIGSLAEEPQTVYLIVPAENIEAGAQWVSLIVSYMIEAVAARMGAVRTMFMLDELANLPYVSAIPKALKLYRGQGVQLWGFCQGRHSLKEVGYSEHVIKEFEDQAGVFQMWGVEDPSLLKDVETWSGKAGVAVKTRSASFAASANYNVSVSETARSVLQVEDIRGIGAWDQILKVRGVAPLFLAERRPWWEIEGIRDRVRDHRKVHGMA
jgi:type IV secretion system protein VirD4